MLVKFNVGSFQFSKKLYKCGNFDTKSYYWLNWNVTAIFLILLQNFRYVRIKAYGFSLEVVRLCNNIRIKSYLFSTVMWRLKASHNDVKNFWADPAKWILGTIRWNKLWRNIPVFLHRCFHFYFLDFYTPVQNDSFSTITVSLEHMLFLNLDLSQKNIVIVC